MRHIILLLYVGGALLITYLVGMDYITHVHPWWLFVYVGVFGGVVKSAYSKYNANK